MSTTTFPYFGGDEACTPEELGTDKPIEPRRLRTLRLLMIDTSHPLHNTTYTDIRAGDYAEQLMQTAMEESLGWGITFANNGGGQIPGYPENGLVRYEGGYDGGCGEISDEIKVTGLVATYERAS